MQDGRTSISHIENVLGRDMCTSRELLSTPGFGKSSIEAVRLHIHLEILGTLAM